MSSTLTEMQARHQIKERAARAATPRLPSRSRRHQVADRLRRVADRPES